MPHSFLSIHLNSPICKIGPHSQVNPLLSCITCHCQCITQIIQIIFRIGNTITSSYAYCTTNY